jgi:hypothetical protein
VSTSLRLLLEDFLGLMREEGELDVFLSLLLSAMGHEVVYRARKGVKQYGVDISSVGRDEDGRKKLFLWVIKQGDIGRREWTFGPQSVQPSLDELAWGYLESHVNPQYAHLPKKAVVLTNGDFHSTLNLLIATTARKFQREHHIEVTTVNGSTLAAWTERHLLDEHLLPAGSRTLLRRMLANVSTPDLSLRSGVEMVRQLTSLAVEEGGTASARKKRQLVALRGIRAALNLARIYGLSENNLSAAYRLSEFAVLSTWGALHKESTTPHIRKELDALRLQWCELAYEYHERLRPYYQTQDALASVLPDSLLVADRAFEELGRLSLQAIHWGSLAANTGDALALDLTLLYTTHIKALLETHACTASPPYDHGSVVVHAALTALTMLNDHASAKHWLEQLCGRLAQAARTRQYWPVAAPFEDALRIRWGDQEANEESSSTTTIVPVLLTWTAALGREDLFEFLKKQVIPAMPQWCTMNFWSSDFGYDGAVADGKTLQEHGIAEGLMYVPDTCADFLARMSRPLIGVDPIENAEWYRQQAPYIPVLAALHWGLQIPRMMLVRHATALCSQALASPSPSAPTPL